MKICLIIYKIDPHAGSENASGYHIASEILKRYPDATLISRSDNVALLRQDPLFQQADLVAIDVPRALSFYKKKGRGIILYYYIWQYWVGRLVRQLDRRKHFDVIHQINFHADWAPHFITSPQARIIWGPIAHHPPVPFSWFGCRQIPAYLKNVLNRLAKTIFWHANPWLKHAMQRSDIILFANRDKPAAYDMFSAKIHEQAYAGSHWPVSQKTESTPSFRVLFTGRLVTLKGPHLALDAFAYFMNNITLDPSLLPHLDIVGTGALTHNVRQRISKLSHSVTLHDWVERDALRQHYQSADYLLYPSLEAQGLVVSEALSQQCLPLVLAGTGPAFVTGLSELTVYPKSRSYADCVQSMGDRLVDLYQKRLIEPSNHLFLLDKAARRAEQLQWPVIAQEIMMFYDRGHG